MVAGARRGVKRGVDPRLAKPYNGRDQVVLRVLLLLLISRQGMEQEQEQEQEQE